MTWNKNMDDAPRDGTECIFWVSSEKGFKDQTANFYYLPEPKSENQKIVYERLGRKHGWHWADSHELLKRPDLVKGWMLYPQPPEVEG